MLYPERDANDRHEACQSEGEMTDSEPNTSENKPNNITQSTEYASADVAMLLYFGAANCGVSKREKRKPTNSEASLSPRDTDNGNEGDQPY